MQMPPGSAIPSSRAAMLTPSPKISRASTITADIYAHTEDKAFVFFISGREVSNSILKTGGCSNRFDGARELGQKPIARVFDNTASVFRNGRLDSIRQEGSQTCVRSLFVVVHEPRIAGHVGGHYRRQPASDPP